MAMKIGLWLAGVFGVLLAGIVGCSTLDSLGLNLTQTSTPGQERVVVGSLESVAETTQGSLQQLGIATVLTHEGEDLRISYKTSTGDKFSLLLIRVRTPQGERTRIRIEGDKTGGNEPTFLRIVGQFEAASGH
jgi:hypothetical protein